MNEKKERKKREIFRGELEQKKEVWEMSAKGWTAKNIASQFVPELAESTVYKWLKEFSNLPAQGLLAIYEGEVPELITSKWMNYKYRTPEEIADLNKLQSIRKEPYEETPTTKKIRATAIQLAERINLPSIWDKNLWRELPVDFQPGKYNLSIGAFEIDEVKKIKVDCYDVSSNFAEPHLIKGLFSHLSTSPIPKFAKLAGGKGDLSDFAIEASIYSEKLLKCLKLIADEVQGAGTKLNFHDEPKPGLTRWFIVTVWIDALQRADSGHWMDDSWYKSPESITGTDLMKLNCGAYTIGIARSEKTLKSYENWHKKLREKYSIDPLTKQISDEKKELSIAADQISQLLQEFSDMRYLPGHCDVC